MKWVKSCDKELCCVPVSQPEDVGGYSYIGEHMSSQPCLRHCWFSSACWWRRPVSDNVRKCELQSVARWRWWPRTTQEDPVSIMSGEGSNDCRMLRVSGRRVGSGAVSAVVLQRLCSSLQHGVSRLQLQGQWPARPAWVL